MLEYKNLRIISYETLLFDTKDGDLDITEYALNEESTGPKAPKCFGVTSRKIRRANKCQKNCPSFKQCGDKHAENEKI